jgi:hypothetical protein
MGQAQSAAADFESKVLYSTPIGFYTWNETLRQVYKQDRFFQNQLAEMEADSSLTTAEVGRFAAMAAVMQDATDLRPQYESIVALYSGLTNPYNTYSVASLFEYVDGVASLDDVSAIRDAFVADHPTPFVCRGTYLALFPASRSKDSEFFQEMFCYEAPPSDVTTIDILINAIRENVIDLSPDPDSGWYDYQLYALETLLVPNRGPESDHLLLTKAYKEKLIETFKSIITQTRETHVKQLDVPALAGSAPPSREVDIYPKFPVEPFPTFYLRTARGYRFLKTYLQGVLGTDFLEARERLHADGSSSVQPLVVELDEIIRRTYGLYVISARSVGLDPQEYLLAEETAEYSIQECVDTVEGWLAQWSGDPDILADPRVIVPASYDMESDEIIYWATLGVKVIRVTAEFVEGYEPEVVSSGQGCTLREILDHEYVLLMEEMREVRIRADRSPPTREELREICDRHESADDIVSDLEAL